MVTSFTHCSMMGKENILNHQPSYYVKPTMIELCEGHSEDISESTYFSPSLGETGIRVSENDHWL